jgi:hypothetical protein
MVETITPVVHGGSRRRYWLSVALHALGATLSAALIGALLGGVGALAGAPWGRAGLVAVAVVAVVYAAREGLRLPIPLPDRHAQVPDWWRTFYSPGVAAFLYGAGLGAGFFTFLSFGTYVAVVAGAVASGSPVIGAALCIPFGVMRGLSVTVSRSARSEHDAERVMNRLDELGSSPGPRLINAATLVVVAGAAAATAI